MLGMVVGAANRTEWLTGTFTQFGCDHIADVMPILHLYRSQLEVLATHLHLPEEIRKKKQQTPMSCPVWTIKAGYWDPLRSLTRSCGG